ncbi:MAG: ribonuclease J [Rhodospirillales bacterium]|nr:ribonuclease J [Rhodospirillales bacterium]
MTQQDQGDLVFVPLGGAGEIGMNLNLYGYGTENEQSWVMIDLGVTFNDGSIPGVDLIMPDPSFIEEQRDDLLALVLTHAHEDHLGAVPYLWRRLRCPIYATPFTASVLRRKLVEADLLDEVEIIVVPLNGRFQIGPFDFELITLTHSIPEPNAIAIRTPTGTVLHTGDWKFDPDPVVGEASDLEALRRLGDEGVRAMVCDSTNVFTPGESGSEAELLANLTRLIGEATGKVAVACFASNVARLETISQAARANGREIVIAGQSLIRIEKAARENGYLAETPAFIQQEEASSVPAAKSVIICTGSQGESRAALSRIAANDHPYISLGSGDTVLFSSRVIPGNETSIAHLQNQLVRLGVDIVTAKDEFIHVSGHPARDELAYMYQLVRPEVSIPVHGELRHLREHARLARECQVATAIVAENGSVIRIGPGDAKIVDHVYSGRLILEGSRLVPMDSEIFKSRTRAMWHGTATVSIVVDEDGEMLADPQLSTTGLFENDRDPIYLEAIVQAEEAVSALSDRHVRDDGRVREAVRLAVRRHLRNHLGKKPVTEVHLMRIS